MTPDLLLFLFGGICSGAVAAGFLAKWYWSDRQAYDLGWAVAMASNAVGVSLFGLSFDLGWTWAWVVAVVFYWTSLGALAFANFRVNGKGPSVVSIALLMTFLAVVSIAVELGHQPSWRWVFGVTAGAVYVWTGWQIRRLPVVGRFAALTFMIRGVCIITLTLLPPTIDRSGLNLFSNAMALISGLLLILGSLLRSRETLLEAEHRLREAHRALARSNEELKAQTVALTAAAVENGAALRRAEAAVVAKQNFIANMNHELRTPLNAVLGFTELLKLRTSAAATRELYEYAECAHAGATAMLRKISRIIDFVAIDNAREDDALTPFKPAAVLVEELHCLSELGAHKQLTFARNLDHDFMLPRHECRFRVIVRELTQNAINAAPACSEIAIVLRVNGNSAVLEVRDTGPGLPDAFVSTVGESFNISQPVLTRGDTQGVGLGLAIVNRHMEIIGGYLKFQRNVPRGTTAIAEFPLAEPLAAAS